MYIITVNPYEALLYDCFCSHLYAHLNVSDTGELQHQIQRWRNTALYFPSPFGDASDDFFTGLDLDLSEQDEKLLAFLTPLPEDIRPGCARAFRKLDTGLQMLLLNWVSSERARKKISAGVLFWNSVFLSKQMTWDEMEHYATHLHGSTLLSSLFSFLEFSYCDDDLLFYKESYVFNRHFLCALALEKGLSVWSKDGVSAPETFAAIESNDLKSAILREMPSPDKYVEKISEDFDLDDPSAYCLGAAMYQLKSASMLSELTSVKVGFLFSRDYIEAITRSKDLPLQAAPDYCFDKDDIALLSFAQRSSHPKLSPRLSKSKEFALRALSVYPLKSLFGMSRFIHCFDKKVLKDNEVSQAIKAAFPKYVKVFESFLSHKE